MTPKNPSVPEVKGEAQALYSSGDVRTVVLSSGPGTGNIGTTGDTSEVQVPQSSPRPTESEALRMGLKELVPTSLPGRI